ncbi:class I SAM-dependent methyltransferase [Saccharothrix sp. Mg75]|uniref:class I SAM-dependent methyltransferase n=1 Tax=Saccharothrix sp. Mg75 TaxID=3445357 RepID=UPI003EEE61A6
MGSSMVDAFDEGSAEFAEWAPLLWDPIGAEAVEHARPLPGERVLDICCGSGSSAIPAARAVGVGGVVDAVDLSGALLDQGARRARDVPQLRFHRADAAGWEPADRLPYDRVQSGFGVFFLPDTDTAVDHLVGLLRPGGTLAVSTWRQGSVDDVVGPLIRAFAEHTGAPPVRPPAAGQAARLDTGDELADWLRDRGLVDVVGHAAERDVPVTPEPAWTFVTGSAVRAVLAGLDADGVSAVKARYLDVAGGTAVLRARALVGVGARPS